MTTFASCKCSTRFLILWNSNMDTGNLDTHLTAEELKTTMRDKGVLKSHHRSPNPTEVNQVSNFILKLILKLHSFVNYLLTENMHSLPYTCCCDHDDLLILTKMYKKHKFIDKFWANDSKSSISGLFSITDSRQFKSCANLHIGYTTWKYANRIWFLLSEFIT